MARKRVGQPGNTKALKQGFIRASSRNKRRMTYHCWRMSCPTKLRCCALLRGGFPGLQPGGAAEGAGAIG